MSNNITQQLTENQILEKYEKKKELQRLRSKKHYEKHRDDILLKRKIYDEKQKEMFIQVKKNQPEPELPKPTFSDFTKKMSLDKTLFLLDQHNFTSQKTKHNYINMTKLLFEVCECDDLIKALPNFDKIVFSIENAFKKYTGEKYSNNTKKLIYQTIVFIINNLDDLHISKSVNQKYIDIFNKYKIVSYDENQNKKDNPDYDVLTWDTYLKKILDKYGINSKQYIMSLLYKEVPVRDDFRLNVIEIGNIRDDIRDFPGDNFLKIPLKANLQVIIVNYKTDKKYGILNFKLSKKLSNLIRKYIQDNNIEYNDYLFGNDITNTKFVHEMNSSIGIKGSINYYRQMTISSLLETIPSPQERVELAKLMGHAPVSQLKYFRGIVPVHPV
jgi:hypothetical protein